MIAGAHMTTASTPESSEGAPDAQRLGRDAAQSLADARSQAGALHEPGQREIYRERLARAIALASGALVAAEKEAAGDVHAPPELAAARAGRAAVASSARSTLALAHAARADDALHGARQLSLSAQRAPTRDACDAGWVRVEAIAAGAEASARVAAEVAAEIERDAPGSALARRMRAAAGKAEAAGREARQLVEARNHAYTFHTDGGFSFGEGWYVAAAAVLADVAIQIEPSKPGTPHAERFLHDAGLRGNLQPYRARPRAVKQTTEIVASAFAADPLAAQRSLRAAFLGDPDPPASVIAWADARLAGAPVGRKVLLWVRDGVHHPHRNTSTTELAELATRAQGAGLVPVVIGEAVRAEDFPRGAVDLTLFSRDPVFQKVETRRAQLQLFEHLKRRHGVVGQLGVTTAGMDGPALMGLATMYLTDVRNVRMHAWVGAVPGYREVVRDEGYLERVSAVLSEWARDGPTTDAVPAPGGLSGQPR
jgi:hypothetical protein